MASTNAKDRKAPPPDDRLQQLRARVAQAPVQPGIYRWKAEDGTVLYVGKAKNLRNRLRSYVAEKQSPGPWRQSFLRQIADFDVTVTNTELEALIFETNLIKELRPKYNVLMKDDKNYIYARVTVQDPYPRIESVRRIDPKDKAKYFGPMPSGGELWETLTMLRKIFPFRTCRMEIEPVESGKLKVESGELSAKRANSLSTFHSPLSTGPSPKQTVTIDVVTRHRDRPTPCLDHHIGKCVAPCIGTVTPEQYYKDCIEGVVQFLKGDFVSVETILKDRMRQAALDRKFELAARLRDHLLAIQRMKEKETQIATDTTGEDSDIIAVALLSGRAHVVVMQRRAGRLVGDYHYKLSGEPESPAEALEQFILQYYDDGADIPDTLIVSEDLPDAPVVEELLSGIRGKKVHMLLPERGRKSHLLQLAEKNVREKARLEEVKWETEKRNTENALQNLAEMLGLPEPPQRIEGYDISHLGGTETVGSMVVLCKGKTRNDQYRSFTIHTLKAGQVDDYKSLQEVLRRRLRRLALDVPAEEKEWNANGVTVAKAKKADQGAIEEIVKAHPGDLGSDGLAYKDFLIARQDERVVGIGRLCEYAPKLRTIRSVWVGQEFRGRKLGQFIIRKLLRRVKKGKVYLHAKESLFDYYAALGFRPVDKPPRPLQEKMDAFHAAHPESGPTLIMMWEAHQHTVDPSLAAKPDLLVIDGGKGQLSAVMEVLRESQADIPVIGLAKREEDVFLPGRPDPVPFPPGSSAKFLLMRLRDEAHRFANRHRETRGKKRAVTSALDDVPGIGDMTKARLLKKFGSVEGIKNASDDALREIVGPMQVQQLRRSL